MVFKESEQVKRERRQAAINEYESSRKNHSAILIKKSGCTDDSELQKCKDGRYRSENMVYWIEDGYLRFDVPDHIHWILLGWGYGEDDLVYDAEYDRIPLSKIYPKCYNIYVRGFISTEEREYFTDRIVLNNLV